MSPIVIPLAVFAMVVLIVAIANVTNLRNREIEVHQQVHAQEMEHRTKMRVLDLELQRIKQGT